jgi:uncharacterized membrane protein YphA (DoxX/SURF4 family)
MKKVNIIYWIFTIPFAGFMLFSAIPDVIQNPQAIVFITSLGYPAYFVPFLGIAKVLGVIAILVPGFPRLKEWAYAGLAYDLIAAVYSVSMVTGLDATGIVFMTLLFVFGTTSYIYSHKRRKAADPVKVQSPAWNG